MALITQHGRDFFKEERETRALVLTVIDENFDGLRSRDNPKLA